MNVDIETGIYEPRTPSSSHIIYLLRLSQVHLTQLLERS